MFNLDDIAPAGYETPDPEARHFIEAATKACEHAFQPIVDIHNGSVFGYEALLRGFEKLGFNSPHDVFDHAASLGVLHRFDIHMREQAFSKFCMLPRTPRTRLFYNLDGRIINSADYFKGATKALLKQVNLSASSLVLEITERFETAGELTKQNLAVYRHEAYNTAIDDFGAGYSGLKLLLDHHPDYIKIDQSFIGALATDKKCKLIVSKITDLAHVLGIFVVAEGIEDKQSLRICKEIGCDLVQGFYIAEPELDPALLRTEYPIIAEIGHRNLQNGNDDSRIIYEQIEYRPPLRIDDDMKTVFEAFRSNKDMTFFPVVDESGNPMGIVREHTLKDYTYSPFGKDLIANRATGLTLRRFLSPCPVADIQASAQSIMENFSLSENPEGILIVKEFGYLGFLSAASLLRIINEKNLAQARDSSPLTKLPGNSTIASLVTEACNNPAERTTLIYLDLDNFKAFNDAYGFRQGDRAILLFAELMRKIFKQEDCFLGHVGGDDFFIAVRHRSLDHVRPALDKLLKDFADDVQSFYAPEAREAGYICGKDRHGEMRQFPLMNCSAAVIHLAAQRADNTPSHETLDATIAASKKAAKDSDDHVAIVMF